MCGPRSGGPGGRAAGTRGRPLRPPSSFAEKTNRVECEAGEGRRGGSWHASSVPVWRSGPRQVPGHECGQGMDFRQLRACESAGTWTTAFRGKREKDETPLTTRCWGHRAAGPRRAEQQRFVSKGAQLSRTNVTASRRGTTGKQAGRRRERGWAASRLRHTGRRKQLSRRPVAARVPASPAFADSPASMPRHPTSPPTPSPPEASLCLLHAAP